MWWLFLTLLTAWNVGATIRMGRRFALGSTILLSFLVPCWMQLSVAGLPIDLRVAGASVALITYCLHPRTQWRGPIVFADLAMLSLMTVHVVSDSERDGFHWLILLRAYGEWGLLYVAGRFAIQHTSDLRRLLPVACLVALLLAAWSITEPAAHCNPADYLVGHRPTDTAASTASRAGLKRAEGPLQHPIYFGLLQILFFPWTLEAARSWRNRGGPRWPLAAPWLSAGGILATLSRGPALALVAMLYFVGLLMLPGWRKGLLALGVCALLLASVRYDTVLNGLNFWSGDTSLKHRPKILVDGRMVEYNGTLHRLLIWQVYLRVMGRAGLLGFGTECTTGFPVRVPFGPEDKQTLEMLRYVDNEYILLDLRFGILGVAGLLALLLSAATNFLRLSLATANDCRLLCAGMTSAICAVTLALLTVWLPHDFGALLLWTAGVGSGLRAAPVEKIRPRASGRSDQRVAGNGR
jgi:hypothetical protein